MINIEVDQTKTNTEVSKITFEKVVIDINRKEEMINTEVDRTKTNTDVS